jgi:hypothetical protein
MLIAQQEIDLGQLKPPSTPFSPQEGVKDISGAGSAGESLVKFITMFFGFITTLAGLMFLMYFIFAALSWITSGGDKGKVEHAQNQMTNAAIGLIIVIAAYGIAGIVGGVLGIDILDPISLLKTIGPGN